MICEIMIGAVLVAAALLVQAEGSDVMSVN